MSGTWLALLIAAMRAAPVQAPPDAEKLPAAAVDHVVVSEVRESNCRGCTYQRRTIIRAGSWVRDERLYRDHSETSYSDFASGTSFRVRRDAAGAVRTVAIERHRPRRSPLFIRRTPTGRRDIALGEPCTIWSLTAEVYRFESCETADGIQLWMRQLSQRDRTSLSLEHAVSVERRPVRPQAARPPAEFFRLVPHPGEDAGPISDTPAYEVRLVSGSRRRRQEQVLRRLGELGSSASLFDDGTRHYGGSDGVTRFSYSTHSDGRPISFEISRIDTGGPRLVPERWEPVPGRRPRTVLGERCTWQQRADMRSSDVRHECRTADGIALMLFIDWHWDSRHDRYRALSLSRRPPDPGAFAVPAAALDWRSWGVEPPS